MICADDTGALLFLYDQIEDGPCAADYWYADAKEAMAAAAERLGVNRTAWREIPDPPPFCQQDWITPTRIPGREIGQPRWGRLEQLRDGKWVEINMEGSD